MSRSDDPPRLLDARATPDALRALLRDARDAAPSPEQHARMLARLAAVDAGSQPPPDASAASAGPPGWRRWPYQILGGLCVLAALVLALRVPRATPSRAASTPSLAASAPHEPRAPSPAAPSTAPSSSTALPTAPAVLPVPAPEATDASAPQLAVAAHAASTAAQRPRPAPLARTQPEPSSRCVPAEQLARITAAERDLRRGEHRGALAALEQDGVACPDGALSEERERIAIEALARLGRVPQARARWQRFRAHFPASVYHRRLEVILQGDGSPGP